MKKKRIQIKNNVDFLSSRWLFSYYFSFCFFFFRHIMISISSIFSLFYFFSLLIILYIYFLPFLLIFLCYFCNNLLPYLKLFLYFFPNKLSHSIFILRKYYNDPFFSFRLEFFIMLIALSLLIYQK